MESIVWAKERLLEKKENIIKDTSGTTGFNEPQPLSFAGLNHNPFPMAPDDSDFYLSEHTEKVIDKIIDAVLSQKGFMLLTGEIGLGKTTLTRRIITMLEKHHVKTSLILQSFYQEKELLVAINRDFGIDTNDLTITTQMELLNEFLLERNQNGENCAVIIDDAQNLTFESLELIRMVSNLEADGQKLVQILLVGQTELLEKMESHELRQLKSRVTIWEKPIPLNSSETQRYVQFKLTQAGDTGRIQIEKKAFAKLFQLSRGNLRRINIIMDRA
ncbi:MAG: AAA family ATPase, partial [Bacteroidetes bacterium]|nr:AAA family ATPase [Bacteroidota bacterium]